MKSQNSEMSKLNKIRKIGQFIKKLGKIRTFIQNLQKVGKLGPLGGLYVVIYSDLSFIYPTVWLYIAISKVFYLKFDLIKFVYCQLSFYYLLNCWLQVKFLSNFVIL